jgi:transcriptional regulator with XRE-family HTH domain
MERIEPMNGTRDKWDDPEYARIVEAEPVGDAVRVSFGNGDAVEIELDALGLGAFTQFSVDEESGALVADEAGQVSQIDWVRLRSLSDPAFAEEIRRRDADEGRRIGLRLRALREDREISQKDAAQRAGMPASQLSRIEAGTSDVRLSTIQTLLRALDASLADVAGPDAPEVSAKEYGRRARKAGVSPGTIQRFREHFSLAQMPGAFARAFCWDLEELKQGVPVTPELQVQVAFSTKSPETVRSSPMVRLARTISELAAQGFDGAVMELPGDAETVRREASGPNGDPTLGSLLEWAWDHGIVVVPMPGRDFAGAAWYVGDRPVIVLNVRPEYVAYWRFVLAHEIGHLVRGHVLPGGSGLVDYLNPTSPLNHDDRPTETEANDFALELLIPGRAALFTAVSDRSGSTPDEQRRSFKWKARDVAEEHGLNVPGFVLAAAYALPEIARPQDRWGSAVNFAKEEGKGRPTVIDAFAQRIDLASLHEQDAALVQVVVFE